MNTIKEEQLNRYFEHAMTPGEEQNFLISVAASDEMRIAFRSQLELMKAVRSDKDSLRVGASGQPVAHVRSRTLTALGLSATAVTPFIEHELTRSSAAPTDAGVSMPTSWLARAARFFRHPALALATGLAAGTLTTVAVMEQSSHTGANSASIHAVQAPPAEAKTQAIPQAEPLSPANALNSSDRVEGQALRHTSHSGHAVAHRIPASAAKTANANAIPEISRSTSASIRSNKATIINDNDSAKN